MAKGRTGKPSRKKRRKQRIKSERAAEHGLPSRSVKRPAKLEKSSGAHAATFTALTDGETILPMVTSQDHKPVFDGDRGLNTGGMGAYSPAPVVTEQMHHKIMTEIIEPTIRGMANEGRKFVGILYAGLMIDAEGPKVLEFNCRLGDPEAQVIRFRLPDR